MRIGEPLQHHGARALGRYHPIGATIEWPDRASRRQCPELREHVPETGHLEQMDAARDCQVALTAPQAHQRVLDGQQGRCASGINRVRRSVQVQTICNARSNEVRHAGRDRIRF
jgi:hypothetical protein